MIEDYVLLSKQGVNGCVVVPCLSCVAILIGVGPLTPAGETGYGVGRQEGCISKQHKHTTHTHTYSYTQKHQLLVFCLLFVFCLLGKCLFKSANCLLSLCVVPKRVTNQAHRRRQQNLTKTYRTKNDRPSSTATTCGLSVVLLEPYVARKPL